MSSMPKSMKGKSFPISRGPSPPKRGPVRDNPPYIAQCPFEIVSQRGVSHAFALISKGIAQVSLRGIYPFCAGGGGCRTSTSHALQGGTAQKRGRGCRTQLAMLGHQNPITRKLGGVSLRYLVGISAPPKKFCPPPPPEIPRRHPPGPFPPPLLREPHPPRPGIFN